MFHDVQISCLNPLKTKYFFKNAVLSRSNVKKIIIFIVIDKEIRKEHVSMFKV